MIEHLSKDKETLKREYEEFKMQNEELNRVIALRKTNLYKA
jgi:hypothetical protein